MVCKSARRLSRDVFSGLMPRIMPIVVSESDPSREGCKDML